MHPGILLSPSPRLHEEIEDLFSWLSPTAREHEHRLSVIARVEAVVGQLWPDAKVDVFGSFRTGLYLPTR